LGQAIKIPLDEETAKLLPPLSVCRKKIA